MKRLLHHLRVGALYFTQAVKMRLEYRADFFVECLAALTSQAAGLLLLQFIFNNFHTLREWSREEVFFIYGFSLLPMALFDLIAPSFYHFSDRYIIQGELDRILLRPLSALFQLFMEGISLDALADLALGIVILSYAWTHAGPPLTPWLAVYLVLAVLGAWGVLAGLFLAITASSFWVQERLGMVPPIYNLLAFSRYPLNIYRPFVRVLLTWVIPFGFVAFYPSAGFLAKGESFRAFSYCVPLVGAAMLALGAFIWHRGLRRYAGAGT